MKQYLWAVKFEQVHIRYGFEGPGFTSPKNYCAFVIGRVQLFIPPGLWPARLLSPWGSPGKNPGVGGHSLLQGVFLTEWSKPSLLHLISFMGRQTLCHCTTGKPFHNKTIAIISPFGSYQTLSLHIHIDFNLINASLLKKLVKTE